MVVEMVDEGRGLAFFTSKRPGFEIKGPERIPFTRLGFEEEVR